MNLNHFFCFKTTNHDFLVIIHVLFPIPQTSPLPLNVGKQSRAVQQESKSEPRMRIKTFIKMLFICSRALVGIISNDPELFCFSFTLLATPFGAVGLEIVLRDRGRYKETQSHTRKPCTTAWSFVKHKSRSEVSATRALSGLAGKSVTATTKTVQQCSQQDMRDHKNIH